MVGIFWFMFVSVVLHITNSSKRIKRKSKNGISRNRYINDYIHNHIADITYIIATENSSYDDHVKDDVTEFLLMIAETKDIDSLFPHRFQKEKLYIVLTAYEHGFVTKVDDILKALYFIMTMANEPYKVSFDVYYPSTVKNRYSGRDVLGQLEKKLKHKGVKYVE